MSKLMILVIAIAVCSCTAISKFSTPKTEVMLIKTYTDLLVLKDDPKADIVLKDIDSIAAYLNIKFPPLTIETLKSSK